MPLACPKNLVIPYYQLFRQRSLFPVRMGKARTPRTADVQLECPSRLLPLQFLKKPSLILQCPQSGRSWPHLTVFDTFLSLEFPLNSQSGLESWSDSGSQFPFPATPFAGVLCIPSGVHVTLSELAASDTHCLDLSVSYGYNMVPFQWYHSSFVSWNTYTEQGSLIDCLIILKYRSYRKRWKLISLIHQLQE